MEALTDQATECRDMLATLTALDMELEWTEDVFEVKVSVEDLSSRYSVKVPSTFVIVASSSIPRRLNLPAKMEEIEKKSKGSYNLITEAANSNIKTILRQLSFFKETS